MISNPICLRVKGPFACFTRPEFHVERVSYPVMTPSAARGILEAILMKPVEKPEAARRADNVGFTWHILRIGIVEKGFLMPIRRNELGYQRHPSYGNAKGYDISDSNNRAQRHSLILKKVEYLIEAVIKLDGLDNRKGSSRLLAKYHSMFVRRALKGQCFYQPFLGCREFSVSEWGLADNPKDARPDITINEDFGIMFRDFEFDAVWDHWGHEQGKPRPKNWQDQRNYTIHPVSKKPLHAVAKDGWITVARISESDDDVEDV